MSVSTSRHQKRVSSLGRLELWLVCLSVKPLAKRIKGYPAFSAPASELLEVALRGHFSSGRFADLIVCVCLRVSVSVSECV